MMEKLYDIEEFVRLLAKKGYNDYFMTNCAYPGRLKESLETYFEKCKTGEEPGGPEEKLMLKTYLKWHGPDRDYVTGDFSVVQKDGRLDVREMYITLGHRQKLFRNYVELKNLTTDHIPHINKAIQMVTNHRKYQNIIANSRKGFKLR